MRQNKPTDEEVEQSNAQLKASMLDDITLEMEVVAWSELSDSMLLNAQAMKLAHENLPGDTPDMVEKALSTQGGKMLLYHFLAEREMKRCRALLEKQVKF